jgi:hypothetical protein
VLQTKKKVRSIEPKQSTINKLSSFLQVQFYVGEVVEVVGENCWGVVAGWDLEAKVPDDWLTTVYAGNADRMRQPHFLVFLDLRHIDVDQFEMVYVGQVLFVSLKNKGTTER